MQIILFLSIDFDIWDSGSYYLHGNNFCMSLGGVLGDILNGVGLHRLSDAVTESAIRDLVISCRAKVTRHVPNSKAYAECVLDLPVQTGDGGADRGDRTGQLRAGG